MYDEYNIEISMPDGSAVPADTSRYALKWLETFQPKLYCRFDTDEASMCGDWDDHFDDMYQVSLIFPTLVFRVYHIPYALGEPSVTYYYSGRHQEAEEIITWSEFDIELFTPRQEAV